MFARLYPDICKEAETQRLQIDCCALVLARMAGELVKKGQFGNMVALRGTEIVAVPLCEVAGKLKGIPADSQLLRHAKLLGISMGV